MMEIKNLPLDFGNAEPNGMPFVFDFEFDQWCFATYGSPEDYHGPSLSTVAMEATLFVFLEGKHERIRSEILMFAASQGHRVVSIFSDDPASTARWVEFIRTINPLAGFLTFSSVPIAAC